MLPVVYRMHFIAVISKPFLEVTPEILIGILPSNLPRVILKVASRISGINLKIIHSEIISEILPIF